MNKDYYKILRVKEDATQDEIKKSYRALSKQYHPDVNPEGKDVFQDIAEAYNVIGDPNKRKEYDMSLKNPYVNFNNMEDLSEFINRGFNPFVNVRRPKAPDKIVNLNLTPFESFNGVKKTVNYQRKEKCLDCDGNGGEKEICIICSGQGYQQKRFQIGGGIHIQNFTCTACQGTGFTLKTFCFNCSGQGTKPNLNSITLDIPRSIDDGNFLRIPNSGDYVNNIGYGDLIVQVRMVNDGVYQKINQNLHMNVRIAPENIFIREDIKLDHPEGPIMIKFPNKFSTAIPIRLRNKGYHTDEGRGDFILKFDVDDSLSNIDNEKLNKMTKLIKERENISNNINSPDN